MKHVQLTLGYLREQRAKIDTAIALLEACVGETRNGHRATLQVADAALALHAQRQARTPPAPGSSWADTKARRAAKKETILAILREAGPKGLALHDLVAAARAHGIDKLTGINGLVKNGTLRRSGTRKGQFRYAAVETR